MKGLDTPAAPQGAAKGTVGGLLPGKGQNGRSGAAGREEGGLAFRALLKALNGAQPGHPGPRGGKEEPELDSGEPAPEAPAVSAPAPAPVAVADASATATLLLDALRAPVVAEPQGQATAHPRERQGGAKAGATTDLPSATDRTVGGGSPMPSGPIMPSDAKSDLDTTDLAVLAQLAGADGEQAAAAGEKGEAKPLAATPSFTITRQETYLPPVQKLSPFEQVVEPVRQAASELLSARSELTDGLSGKPSEIATPTKILHIELKPVELGSIVVKMRLSQGGMEIRIEASKAETATMLANDRDTLREIVRASGHSIDAVSVETIHVEQLQPDRHNPAPRQQESGQSDGGARDRQGFDQSRQGEQGRGARHENARPDPATSKDMQDENDTGGGDRRRYL